MDDARRAPVRCENPQPLTASGVARDESSTGVVIVSGACPESGPLVVRLVVRPAPSERLFAERMAGSCSDVGRGGRIRTDDHQSPRRVGPRTMYRDSCMKSRRGRSLSGAFGGGLSGGLVVRLVVRSGTTSAASRAPRIGTHDWWPSALRNGPPDGRRAAVTIHRDPSRPRDPEVRIARRSPASRSQPTTARFDPRGSLGSAAAP